MQIEEAVEKLVDEALGLTGAQLAGLAAATRGAVGRGPAAWRGLRPSPALRAASAAASRRGRTGLLRRAELGLSEALLGAASSAAAAAGRDTGGIRPAWEEFRRATDSGVAKQQRAAFRRFRRALRDGLGRPAERQWLLAGIGARWALLAVVTWDVAGADGDYPLAQREELTVPWRAVAPLPS